MLNRQLEIMKTRLLIFIFILFNIGRGRDLGDGVDKRYVMLYGKAGAGKSTIIDLIVNHVYDVGYEDDFRLTAIDKMPDETNIDEALSQTQWITCYEMKRKENSMLPYDLVIIDTPGLQWENGIETETLKSRFKSLFQSGRLPGLHAICFVNQSNSGRLTSTESFLSQTLSEIFGQNLTENIFIFATCADSPDSLVTRILKRVGFQFHKCFKFSNTPFTIEHQMSRSIDQQNDWEKGKSEIFDFFGILKNIHLRSYESFKGDAKNCEKLRLKYDAKCEEISDACYGLISILNKTVQYERIKDRNPSAKLSTICNKCKRNCCSPCIASFVNKRICWNIHFFSGICVACGDTCTIRDHEYGSEIFIQAPKLVPKPLESSNRVDDVVLSTERETIRTKGLHLLRIIKTATLLQNELQRLTRLGTKYSERDLIDSFIKEKTVRQSLDWNLFVAIFVKCKIELNLHDEEKWKDLDDLLIDINK